ncbi:17835_t:CDS:2 [Cetraspora pellucida]|uniref:17835_t:CDS:1 n=1 Tax=Cetraspora pellucida TaxID=1433469 RepID=A0ACA9LJ05_9GLOM|nr:17835_t:CDS:2 [Cetraspora pellucida]
MLSIKYSAVVLFITAILFIIVNGANPNYMLQLVNAERKKNNLPALTLDSRLTKAAQNHADYMASIKTLTHNDKSGDTGARIKSQGYSWSAYGENIAYGQKNEVEVMKTWMNSPFHKENILDKRFKNLGVGYSSNGNYWTQDFAAPI